MTLTTTFFQFRGYAFKPDAISFGDGESLNVSVNRNGVVNQIPIKKRTVTFSLVGATDVDLVKLQNERDNNIAGLISGSAQGEDINILGYQILDALLTEVKPTAPITVNGYNIFEKIELIYASQVFV